MTNSISSNVIKRRRCGQLILVDGQSQFVRFRRQAFVAVGELSPFAARVLGAGFILAAIDESFVGFDNDVGHGGALRYGCACLDV